MKLLKILTVCIMLPVIVGCTALTPQQKIEYGMMKEAGVLVEEKNPTTGAWLGLLPGGGAFYAREPAIGVIDLLLWAPSIFWDPFVGYEMSKKINYDITVSKLRRSKSRELFELENQRDLGKLSDVEYVTQKRAIDYKYDFNLD